MPLEDHTSDNAMTMTTTMLAFQKYATKSAMAAVTYASYLYILEKGKLPPKPEFVTWSQEVFTKMYNTVGEEIVRISRENDIPDEVIDGFVGEGMNVAHDHAWGMLATNLHEWYRRAQRDMTKGNN